MMQLMALGPMEILVVAPIVSAIFIYLFAKFLVKPALGLDVIIEQNQAILDEFRKQNK